MQIVSMFDSLDPTQYHPSLKRMADVRILRSPLFFLRSATLGISACTSRETSWASSSQHLWVESSQLLLSSYTSL